VRLFNPKFFTSCGPYLRPTFRSFDLTHRSTDLPILCNKNDLKVGKGASK
jgi:hypothetical protein